METRMNLQHVQPDALKALYGLETYLKSTGLSKSHRELIKIRASQINGCAYCIEMHTQDALKMGESPRRIFLLNAWRDSDAYSAEEKAILAMTEQVTNISQGGVSDEVYDELKKYFDEAYIAQILVAIVTINAWNRVSITTRIKF